ncbi:RNA polymerase, sigma 32 subunit, RpoH [Geoalkalibacter ferrihydriticus]|uniref:RNA polymerase sigma factor n=2 Tax=Geoalkalibacter ferrihydriticus TaxID=392333 RepID=A0A0C2HIX8_9BACT|nr:RNA polymerase sigma factor RpoH [Geoalkalibacter ferrihydriticus]KIH77021.1 RNA polymerase sigma 70 [Geoalkalibacter ferrihydriticus DSM 17813]SDL38472.1 RNA polymerase, sigma 32 subunit, RpoH [Geoalkalibacter ferrihydriticus]
MSTTLLPTIHDGIDHYMQQINRFDVLSRQQEYDLAMRYRKRGDIESAHRLICANLRFVVKIANEYRGYGLRILDLIQEGNIGLMLAVKKFNPERGIRLISYAVWWIRAYIHNYIIRSWSLVKIGTTQAQKRLFFKLSQTRALLSSNRDTEADSAQIAEKLSVSDEEVEQMALRMSARDTSLNVELSEGSDYSLLDTLADQRDNQEEQLAEKQQSQVRSTQVRSALKTLNPRERSIINQRILSDSPRTLQEIADDYGISRERVRQVEQNAMRKMREHLAPANAES